MLRNAVVAALTLVLPTLLIGADSPSVVLVATLAAVVVAMTHLAAGFELAPALVAVRVHTDEVSARTMPGRVTDPVHHPIRRRAPGQV
jgi:hypothetical protein